MLVASILLAGGCTRNNEAPPEGPGTETPGTEGPNDNVGREEENIDQDLTEGLKSEAGVSNGRVYEKGDYVIATMMIEEGVSRGKLINWLNDTPSRLRKNILTRRLMFKQYRETKM